MIAAFTVALAVLFTASTAPAGAAIGHKQLSSFGEFTKATDVTIDQANGNVYVTDSSVNAEAGAIDIFGAEGGPPVEVSTTQLTGAGAPQPFHLGHEPAQVAIDESSGSARNLYVSDTTHNVVDRFRLDELTHEYQYVCQLAGVGKACVSENASPTWVEPAGVAVNSATGNVLVASFGPGTGSVTEFTSAAADVRQLSGGDIGAGQGPTGVAVDTTGVIYVNNFHRSVVRVATDGTESFLDQNNSTAVAVDPKTNDVYVDDGTYVAEYTQTGELISRFGQGLIGNGDCQRGENQCSEGLAVNGSTGDIYVSNRERGDVVVFGPAVNVPDARTGTVVTAGKTSGTVSGVVNPADETLSAQYYFEYGTSEEYGARTPETEAGSGTADVPVTAPLGELEAQTPYHYRLVAVNSNGTTFGEDHTFTTHPAVTFRPCATPPTVEPLNATLCALIAPEGLATTYYFQYGRSVEYEAETSPAETEGEAEGEYTAAAANLEPGTSYHYRLVAQNALGTTPGPDETFTTPPNVPAVTSQTPPVTGIGPHVATLRGAVNPGNGVTAYQFEYGPTAAYGSTTPDSYTQLNDQADPVAEIAAGLQAGTLYHFRLVATNASGTGTGPDGTFSTLTMPPAEGLASAEPPPLSVPSTLLQPLTPTLLPMVSWPSVGPAGGPHGGNPKAKKTKRHRRHKRCVKRRRCHRGRK